jgi:hypothetical protein
MTPQASTTFKSPTTLSRSAILFFLFAAICFAASLGVGIWQSSAQSERAEIRATGQRVVAVAVNRKEIEYVTTQGTVRARPIVAPMQGTLQRYDSVDAVYDRDDPTRVVLLQDDSGFNITIWAVVLKLFVAGCVLAFFGYRRSKNLPLYKPRP